MNYHKEKEGIKMKYDCYNKYAEDKKDARWQGEIQALQEKNDGFEAEITGRSSSFYMIVGESERGNYLCIPNWQIGCELASYQDVFWNQEKLEEQVSTVDAITIANGIRLISQIMKDATG